MADDKGGEQGIWPLPQFSFSVQFGDDTAVSFAEVTGLDTETNIIEYRHGNNPSFYPIKMPGLGKVGNVTLRKGIFVKDARSLSWFSEIASDAVARRDILISLLDETGASRMVWTLHNAWPTKVTAIDLKSEGNEIAIQSLEIAFETMEAKAA